MWSRVDRFDKRAFSDRYLDSSLRELVQNVDLGTTAMGPRAAPLVSILELVHRGFVNFRIARRDWKSLGFDVATICLIRGEES
jgi:hypothetical protein